MSNTFFQGWRTIFLGAGGSP